MKKVKIQYFTSEMVKSEFCYVEDEGICRIIGNILFNDGRIGYLTNSNYSEGYDGYEGDRIILIENKATGRIMTENGEFVFASKQDYDNIKYNEKLGRLKKSIETYRDIIKSYTLNIERLNSIICQKDTLTIEQMKKMRTEI